MPRYTYIHIYTLHTYELALQQDSLIDKGRLYSIWFVHEELLHRAQAGSRTEALFPVNAPVGTFVPLPIVGAIPRVGKRVLLVKLCRQA